MYIATLHLYIASMFTQHLFDLCALLPYYAVCTFYCLLLLNLELNQEI